VHRAAAYALSTISALLFFLKNADQLFTSIFFGGINVSVEIIKKKIKKSLLQAVEAPRVARGRVSHIA
jgi:uncharacterized membrane protein YciS (DUF1049 family)